jgi:hypothetical protein
MILAIPIVQEMPDGVGTLTLFVGDVMNPGVRGVT